MNPRCPLTSSKPQHQCHQKTTHVQLIRCKLVWLRLCMIRVFKSLQWLKIFAFVGQITCILVFFCLFDGSHLYIIFSTNKSYIICLMLSCRCLTVLILVAGTSMPSLNSTSLNSCLASLWLQGDRVKTWSLRSLAFFLFFNVTKSLKSVHGDVLTLKGRASGRALGCSMPRCTQTAVRPHPSQAISRSWLKGV